MTDWKVGDLAVCVDASSRVGLGTVLEEGRAYKVLGAATSPAGVLLLMITPSPMPTFVYGHPGAWRFRKVQHDKREACESEFTTLLNRSKRKVGA